MMLGKRLNSLQFGWPIVVGICVAVVLWTGLAASLVWSLIKDVIEGSSVAASKDLIGPLITGTGVLVAVVAYLRDRDKIANDQRDAKSKILYEQAKDGLEDAFKLLEDQNNDRITWIRAARIVGESRKLGKSISSPEYKNAYGLAEDSVRGRLYEALTTKGEHAGQRNALPAAFFFGHPDWRTINKPLGDIAIETSNSVRVFSKTEGQVIPDIPTRNLSGESVLLIMDLLSFPDDYEERDPLRHVDKQIFEKWPDTFGAQQGARDYLRHQQKYQAVSGKLFPR